MKENEDGLIADWEKLIGRTVIVNVGGLHVEASVEALSEHRLMVKLTENTNGFEESTWYPIDKLKLVDTVRQEEEDNLDLEGEADL